MASRKLEVQIVGDSRSLERAFGSSAKAAGGFSSALTKVGKVAALGFGAAFAGLAVTLKMGFDELAEGQKVMAQTGAVLKSTGGAAHVTAEQVSDLANSLSKMSGVDDEVIQSGENMLLTFKGIRNEAGKGNDIFNQATATLLDMSTALGQDMSKSAIQLGKALNDPIKGLTALQRVGVTFTESQKETIKGLVETGHTMEAQKMILRELNSEFGGSAKAFGETMPGQLAKAKNAFDEVAANLAEKFLPMLTQLLNWVNSHWPEISAVINAAGTAIMATFKAIGATVDFLRDQWEKHRDSVIRTWKAVEDAVRRTVQWFQDNVVPPIRTIVNTATKLWDEFGDAIVRVLKTQFGTAVTLLKTYIENFLAPFKIFLALLRGDWSEAWSEIKGVFTRTWNAISTLLSGYVTTVTTTARAIGKGIKDGVVEGVTGIAGKVGDVMQNLWDALKTAAQTAYNAAVKIGGQVISGVWDGISAKLGWLKDKIESALSGIFNALNPFSPVDHGGYLYIGLPIMRGAAQGVLENADLLRDALNDTIVDSLRGTKPAFDDFNETKDDTRDNIVGLGRDSKMAFSLLDKSITDALPNAIAALVPFNDELAGTIDRLQGVTAWAQEAAGALRGFGAATGGGGSGVTKKVDIPAGIPGLAGGGIVRRPTLAMIGERGPEAVVPLSRGGGLGSVVFHFPNYVGDRRELQLAIQEAFGDWERRNGSALIG